MIDALHAQWRSGMMIRSMLGALLFVVVGSGPVSGQAALTAREAARRIGERVVVEDVIAQAYRPQGGAGWYLNFGAAYPDQMFTAYVANDYAHLFPRLDLWGGARVRVTGIVRDLGGIPTIECQEEGQLTLLQAVAPGATPARVQPPERTCCRICRTGVACGNSCIARGRTCRQPPGCACNG